MSEGMQLRYADVVRHLGHRVELHGWAEGLIADEVVVTNRGVDDLPPSVRLECTHCDMTLAMVMEPSQRVRRGIVDEMQREAHDRREEQERADEDERDQFRTDRPE